MISPWRKFQLVLIMLWLPLQGAMAANMSLCLKDNDISGERLETSNSPGLLCPAYLPFPAWRPVWQRKQWVRGLIPQTFLTLIRIP